MATLNLLEETKGHFAEGAKSVRAYSADQTYIITRGQNTGDFFVTLEEPGFQKQKVASLYEFFKDVFGIEATY
jgi:hypothetical protein